MVGDIFEVISQTISSFVASLVSAVNGLLPILYDSTNGSMTFVGTCLLIAVGIGIVYWVFRLLRGVTAGLAR